jgi:NTP pyrophosphatase (non-canonical NTP hydrolase)
MCAAAGELGEAANLIKKRRRGEAVSDRDVLDEIADTVIYLDLLAARLGCSLAEAIERKFDVVSARRGAPSMRAYLEDAPAAGGAS